MDSKAYTFRFTVAEVDTILLALAERPLKDVLAVFNSIHQQYAEQNRPQEPKEAPDEKE